MMEKVKQTRLVSDMMHRVNHVVDDNVIRIMVDDHVHKTNPLKKVEHIPKTLLSENKHQFFINLLDKQNNSYDNARPELEYTCQQ